MHKKKLSMGLYLIIVVAIIIGVYFISQSFSVFTPTNEKVIVFYAKTNQQPVYKFDDYTLSVQTSNSVRAPNGCDTWDNWNFDYYCNSRYDGIDANGCQLYSAARTSYYCGSHCGTHCGSTYSGHTYSIPPTHCVGDYASYTCDETNRRYGGGLVYSLSAAGKGCYWIGSIQYKGITIKNLTGLYENGWTKGSQVVYLTENGQVSDAGNYMYRIDFGGSATDSAGDCIEYTGEAQININPDKINFTVELPNKKIYTDDETQQIKVIVKQDVSNFKGDLKINYQVKTIVGNATRTIIKPVVINKGTNEYLIDIPTDQATKQLMIQPILTFNYDITSWTGSGTDYSCSSTGSNCGFSVKGDYAYVGEVQGDWFNFTIYDASVKQVENLTFALLSASEQVEALKAKIAEAEAIKLQAQTELDGIAAQLSLMQGNINAQKVEIENLRKSVEDNTYIIQQANDNVANQLLLIEDLKKSQAEKEQYIASLLVLISEDKNKVAELLAQLQNNKQIITELGTKLNFSQEKITELYNIIKTSNLEAAELATKLQISTAQAQTILNEVKAKDAEITNIINLYNAKLLEQQIVTKELQTKNADLTQLISQYKLGLISQQDIITKLGISNAELQFALNDYEARVQKLETYINALGKNSEEMQVLINNLKADKDFKEYLYADITKQNTSYKWIILALCAVVGVMIIYLLMTKKRKR